MQEVKIYSEVQEVIAHIRKKTGAEPWIVGTSARDEGGIPCTALRRRLKEGPVLLLFGTGSGLAPHVLAQAQETLRPIRCFDPYNHLSVRSAAAITIDRILGDVR